MAEIKFETPFKPCFQGNARERKKEISFRDCAGNEVEVLLTESLILKPGSKQAVRTSISTFVFTEQQAAELEEFFIQRRASREPKTSEHSLFDVIADDGEVTCVHLASYAAGEQKLVEPDNKIDDRETITIEFTYPLDSGRRFEFTNPGGWTEKAFADAVVKQYQYMYEKEAETSTLPEQNVPGLLNRDRTDGSFGIWGHGISDLYLEGAECDQDGVWHLHIGS